MADKLIKITGYVTEAYSYKFKLHVLNDSIENEQGIHPNISNEIEIFIHNNRYPDDYHAKFEMIGKDEGSYKWRLLREALSICKGLRKGALVNCEVFVVNIKVDSNGSESYEISSDPIHIENYTKYLLYLYPNSNSFQHLDRDTRETLKFRIQNYYTDINKAKFHNVTGGEFYKYSEKWWINKNPKITFPILWWIRIRTITSNLWKRFTKQENLPKASLIANIILAFITAISVTLNIWLLFFKKPSI